MRTEWRKAKTLFAAQLCCAPKPVCAAVHASAMTERPFLYETASGRDKTKSFTWDSTLCYTEKREKESINRLKDIMRKDAIYDDDFDDKQAKDLNDNAKMIYEVIEDYIKAFQNDNNMNIVFINPSELQPIVAALHKYINEIRNIDKMCQINISLKILVKPENKGGRNYLAFWMDELFSKDEKVNIRTYLNEYRNKDDLDSYLNGNNDIVFVMNLLKDNCFSFTREIKEKDNICVDCKYPIVYKPAPVSMTSVKRKIELSQSQFSAAYTHTQIVHYRDKMEMKIDPNENYIVVREVSMDDDVFEC